MARMSSVDRRGEIVQAALRVIAEQGMQGATTRAIVAEAGMPLASFHYAFASRDEMMEELIAHVVENQSIAAFEAIRFSGDIRSTIRDGLQAFFDSIVAETADEQVLLELMLFAMRTPGLESLPQRQWAKYRDAAEQVLVAAAEGAGIQWTVPVETVGRMLVTITDGLTLAWLADRDLSSAARVMDLATDFLYSLTTQPRTKDAIA
jgi:DNA-binding transcriptional regulator YbjK